MARAPRAQWYHALLLQNKYDSRFKRARSDVCFFLRRSTGGKRDVNQPQRMTRGRDLEILWEKSESVGTDFFRGCRQPEQMVRTRRAVEHAD